ncbi:MAG TPA: efflux RND transporter periplasmic adaptor subunit [Candidatus Krumholzibacteria bacterium]|nr:efflux RND transporter periplasmic adaptor subunit [Candidatus Krumholzibacteria bacterium]HPD71879.1 efflux RND transporter periplasmic adaptor subunit [Candidatus Krumholzibacteria bacterium]HRY41188.1 efflux RND transporter periplasmic adaptor subunit [Candidatus Krumholzibacteria bacterium]
MATIARAAARALSIAALAGFPLLAGCGRDEPPVAPPPPVVSVVTVTTESVTLTTELAGRTAPYRVAEIRPQVNGIILKRLFDEGSDVRAGQPLYQIDPAPYQAALEIAQAALARAEATLATMRLRKARFEELLPDRAVSEQDYDDAVAGLKQAEAEVASWTAQVRNARINLGYTEVRAPISGRIGRSNVTEGAVVTAYQPLHLATIQQLDPIYVDLPQSTAEMARLNRRLAAGSLQRDHTDTANTRLFEEDGSEYHLAGTLLSRDVTVDPTTGSVVLRAIFPNPDTELLPDMFVRGVVTEGVDPNAILVPQQGVARTARGDPYAWIVDGEGLAQMRQLAVDRAIGDKWLVTGGLAPGDRVIVEGLLALRRPGTAVQATEFVPAAAPPGAIEENKARTDAGATQPE